MRRRGDERTWRWGRVSRLPAFALFFCLGAASSPTLAGAQTIVLVRPPREDPLRTEAFFRLSGELTQQGFRVVAREASGELGPRELRRIADDEGAVAAMSLGGEQTLPEADVWIVDRATGKTTLRTIATDGSGDAPARLALRAGELLRLSLSEMERQEPGPDVVGAEPALADDRVRKFAANGDAEERVRVWLGVGAAGATSDGWGTMFAPRIGLHLGFESPFELGLVFTGPGGGGSLTVDGARADLAHAQLTLEPRWLVPLGTRWSLAFSPALGVGHLGVRGTAAAPWRALAPSTWVFLLGGRAAVRLEILRHFRISVGVDADVPLPSVEVEVAETVRRLGPFLGGGAMVEVAF